MPLLGAHQSIAGGYHRAVERAVAAGCECLQIFTKSSNRWQSPPLTDEQVSQFQAALLRSPVRRVIGHTAYLINVASPDSALWQKSLESLADEYERADRLGLEALVLHPGSAVSQDADAAIRRVAEAINRLFDRFPRARPLLLLETTAGQGSTLGSSFEELAAIIELTEQSHRLGVCWDTCHMLAADYPLDTPDGWNATVRWFHRVVGLERLRAVHLNDSRTPRGSRVDRHEHIGRGHIGLETFRRLLHDPRVNHLPMFLETPKGNHDDGRDWDVVNLAVLRDLLVSRPQPTSEEPL